jgi:hypothetical protein
MFAALQFVGALAILIAFIAVQAEVIQPTAYIVLGLNLGGAAVLAVSAGSSSQFGFLLLEGCWALVAGWSLVRRIADTPHRTSAIADSEPRGID